MNKVIPSESGIYVMEWETTGIDSPVIRRTDLVDFSIDNGGFWFAAVMTASTEDEGLGFGDLEGRIILFKKLDLKSYLNS